MQPLEPADPRHVAGYRLIGRLGAGGMGRVFLGISPGGRPVAVKVARAELADDPVFRARFRTEVTLARRVQAFCTAPVVDADPEAEPPWLATVYVPGPSLQQAVREYGPLPAPTVRTLVAGLAEALSAVHADGIVHRDLKPSNVLLANDGPRLIDFGISRAMEGTALTRTGLLVGSPGFIAPEQVQGGKAGPPADVFALGATVLFAATGRAPFGAGPGHAVLFRAVTEEPDLSGLPPDLHRLAARCLAKDPAARPTAREALAYMTGTAAAAPSAPGWLPGPVATVAERQETVLRTLPEPPAATRPVQPPLPQQQAARTTAPQPTAHRPAAPYPTPQPAPHATPQTSPHATPQPPRGRPSGRHAAPPAPSPASGPPPATAPPPPAWQPPPSWPAAGQDTRRGGPAATPYNPYAPGTAGRAGRPARTGGPAPDPYRHEADRRSRNTAGIASVVVGVIGILAVSGPGLVLGPLGIWLGVRALRHARQREGTGRMVAVAGVLLSAMALVLALGMLGERG